MSISGDTEYGHSHIDTQTMKGTGFQSRNFVHISCLRNIHFPMKHTLKAPTAQINIYENIRKTGLQNH